LSDVWPAHGNRGEGWNAPPSDTRQPRVIKNYTDCYLRAAATRNKRPNVPGCIGITVRQPLPAVLQNRPQRASPARFCPAGQTLVGRTALMPWPGHPTSCRPPGQRHDHSRPVGKMETVGGGSPMVHRNAPIAGGPRLGISHIAGPGMTHSTGRCTPRSRVPYLHWRVRRVRFHTPPASDAGNGRCPGQRRRYARPATAH
jgi:hypothetical protein